MKAILVSIILGLSISSYAVAAEKKRVCVEQKDAKTGKVKEVCKIIKIHKKLEGTEVPAKK